MKHLTRVLFATIALLVGCTTPYQAEQYGGGYTDLPMSEGRYKISVRGNGVTDRLRVHDIALVRAAEITLQAGKSHFLIIDSGESENDRTDFTSQTATSVKNYYVSLTIKPTNDAQLEGAIDAHAKIKELGPLVGYQGKFK